MKRQARNSAIKARAPKKNSAVVCVTDAGLVRLFVHNSNKMTELTGAAAHIWHMIDGKRTAEDITREIHAEFDVPEERARVDVRRVLNALGNRGICHVLG